MKPEITTLSNKIKSDKELCPYFIDYVAENLKMTLAKFYKVDKQSELKFTTNASKSLVTLTKKLEGKVEEEYLYEVIETVCFHYTKFINFVGTNVFTIDPND